MFKKLAAVAISTAALGASLMAAAPAHAATADPYVVGGTQAPYTPWVVQLQFDDTTNPGAVYGCTGEQIAPQVILTAKHCIQNVSWMNVYFSNSTINRGAPIEADDVAGSPYGDVALVHLSQAKYQSSYPRLTDGYTPQAGQNALLMGYGLRANKTPSTGLFQANVQVVGSSYDAFGGRAIHVQGIDGASNHGDSGGPLMIGGVIVGVCSTGDSYDPGADIHAGSNYANLTDSLDWIYSTAGL